jgi:hypothetical protein
VTFKGLEQLPGNRPLQASPDSHHDGVQRPVELPVTGTIQPMPGQLPRRRQDVEA